MSNTSTAEQLSAPAGVERARISPMALLLPLLIAVLIGLLIAAGAVWWLLRSGKLGGGSPQVVVREVAPPTSHVLPLEPMVVNLTDAGGRSYLRCTLSLRVDDEEKPAKKEEKPEKGAADPVATELRDTTLGVLSSRSADELLAPGGREQLKTLLKEAYRTSNPKVGVREIYFSEFLVQRG